MVVSYKRTRVGLANTPYLFRTYANLKRSDDPQERKFARNPCQAHDIPIWQVARATSAAPTYFEPAVIDGLEYIDGGFGANNPCTEIYEEVKTMNNNYEKSVDIILSVGTGRNKKLNRFQGHGIQQYWNYLNFARKWATDSEKTHEQMIKYKIMSSYKFAYYRLNVEEGLDLMKLDEWNARGPIKRNLGSIIGKGRARSSGAVARQTQASVGKKAQPGNGRALSDTVSAQDGNHPVGNARSQSDSEDAAESDPAPVVAEKEEGTGGRRASSERRSNSINLAAIPRWLQPKNRTLENIREHTRAYLEDDEVKEWLEECAEKLVESRRARAKSHPNRWERTCFNLWYQCNTERCQRAERRYPLRKNMENHLKDKHRDMLGSGYEELEKMLDDRKIIFH